MGWIANKFISWGRKKQIQELTAFTTALSGMDGQEIGLVVAMAADVRNSLHGTSGINLLDPLIVTTNDPTFIFTLTKAIRELQKSGNAPRAAGVMVWAHSVRGITDLEVRPYARAMWGHLGRGFIHAEDAAEGYYYLSREDLDLTDHDEYPKGLTPTPL